MTPAGIIREPARWLRSSRRIRSALASRLSLLADAVRVRYRFGVRGWAGRLLHRPPSRLWRIEHLVQRITRERFFPGTPRDPAAPVFALGVRPTLNFLFPRSEVRTTETLIQRTPAPGERPGLTRGGVASFRPALRCIDNRDPCAAPPDVPRLSSAAVFFRIVERRATVELSSTSRVEMPVMSMPAGTAADDTRPVGWSPQDVASLARIWAPMLAPPTPAGPPSMGGGRGSDGARLRTATESRDAVAGAPLPEAPPAFASRRAGVVERPGSPTSADDHAGVRERALPPNRMDVRAPASESEVARAIGRPDRDAPIRRRANPPIRTTSTRDVPRVVALAIRRVAARPRRHDPSLGTTLPSVRDASTPSSPAETPKLAVDPVVSSKRLGATEPAARPVSASLREVELAYPVTPTRPPVNAGAPARSAAPDEPAKRTEMSRLERRMLIHRAAAEPAVATHAPTRGVAGWRWVIRPLPVHHATSPILATPRLRVASPLPAPARPAPGPSRVDETSLHAVHPAARRRDVRDPRTSGLAANPRAVAFAPPPLAVDARSRRPPREPVDTEPGHFPTRAESESPPAPASPPPDVRRLADAVYGMIVERVRRERMVRGW